MDSSLPGSSVHGIFQARVLKWGAIAFSGRRHYCTVILALEYIRKNNHYESRVPFDGLLGKIFKLNVS